MKISDVIMAETDELPPIGSVMYQYVLAGNGLFIRAEDSRRLEEGSSSITSAPAALTSNVEIPIMHASGALRKPETGNRITFQWLVANVD